MRYGFLRATALALCVVGATSFAPANASIPTVATNAATGDVTVTLASGKRVTVSATIAAQVFTAMNAGDAVAVTSAIKIVVVTYAARDADLAAAIYVLAVNSTSNAALKAAAYAGVVAGNPYSATEVAENSGEGTTAGGGAPSGGSFASSFPTGGTSGGGSSPSPNTP
jgi:uncharacterized membrane protein YgcG